MLVQDTLQSRSCRWWHSLIVTHHSQSQIQVHTTLPGHPCQDWSNEVLYCEMVVLPSKCTHSNCPLVTLLCTGCWSPWSNS